MKFKIPNEYKIGGVKHWVKMKKHLGANDHRKGSSSFFDRVMEIDSDLASPEKRRTFIHEAVHYIDDVFDIKLRESQVKRVATGIAEIIQQLKVAE